MSAIEKVITLTFQSILTSLRERGVSEDDLVFAFGENYQEPPFIDVLPPLDVPPGKRDEVTVMINHTHTTHAIFELPKKFKRRLERMGFISRVCDETYGDGLVIPHNSLEKVWCECEKEGIECNIIEGGSLPIGGPPLPSEEEVRGEFAKYTLSVKKGYVYLRYKKIKPFVIGTSSESSDVKIENVDPLTHEQITTVRTNGESIFDQFIYDTIAQADERLAVHLEAFLCR